jgi:hypothetical protein
VTPATLVLILIVLVVALALVFVVGKALSNWVFELSPGAWLSSVILAFSIGALLASYVDGDWNLVLLAAVPVVIAFVWWIVAAWRKSSSSKSGAAAEA